MPGKPKLICLILVSRWIGLSRVAKRPEMAGPLHRYRWTPTDEGRLFASWVLISRDIETLRSLYDL